MNVVVITFQKAIVDDIQIVIDGKPLNGLMVAGSHSEQVETLDDVLVIEVRAVNSISSVDTIKNIKHGDNFTYMISRDDGRDLNMERKYGFSDSN